MRDDVHEFGARVAAALGEALGDRLVGAYFVGSVALGGYVPGESDIDVIAVCGGAIADEAKPALAEAVFATTRSCPARGLEFTLYRREVVESRPFGADFEINVNGGPEMARDIHLGPEREPAFWYVIDRAIAHRYGVPIYGPAPAQLFTDVPRAQLLGAMTDSMRWHREHERATLYSVLNAARAWRFAVDDVLGSKIEGAAWARKRWREVAVIDAAVELRHGRPATLVEANVDALLDHVEKALSQASSVAQFD
jgi:predicted nucleotidyltransferase